MTLILELIDTFFFGNSMPFSEYPSLYWLNSNNFKSFIHSILRVQLRVVTKVFLNTLENKKLIKQLKFDQQILFLKTWDFFYLINFKKKKRNRKIIFRKSNMGFLQQVRPYVTLSCTNFKATHEWCPLFSLVHLKSCLRIAWEDSCSVNQRT